MCLRIPGPSKHICIPNCGDNQIRGAEQCDFGKDAAALISGDEGYCSFADIGFTYCVPSASVDADGAVTFEMACDLDDTDFEQFQQCTDLGLKTGFAVYDATGALVSYRASRFPSFAAMKKAAWGVLESYAPLAHVVVEGDKNIAAIWRKAAEKQGLSFRTVSAETWREDVLLPRERRDAASAKKAAADLAEQLIRKSRAPAPTGILTSDVAEAVLIGRWSAAQLGWLQL